LLIRESLSLLVVIEMAANTPTISKTRATLIIDVTCDPRVDIFPDLRFVIYNVKIAVNILTTANISQN